MDNLSNTSVNNTSSHPLNSPGFVVFNVVMLLGVVFPVIDVNTGILVALVLESFIVNIIRLVLGSILVSYLLTTHERLVVKTAQLPPSVSSTIPMLSKCDCFLDLAIGRCDGGGEDWLDKEAVDLRDEVGRRSDAPCVLLRRFLPESTDFRG